MGIILKNGDGFHYERKDLPYLIARSTFGTIGILANFYAVDHLVLSDASMLGKLSLFFAIIASAILLHERTNRYQKIAVLVAFVGAAFVVRPSVNIFSNVGSLVAILGALVSGIAYTFVRMLSQRGVKGPKIVFFFSTFSCLVVLPFILMDYHPMSTTQVCMLIMAGLMASGGQFCVTAAYSYAPARDISVYDYTQIIFSALLGFFVLNQVPDFYSFVGYAIICLAAFYNFYHRNEKV